MYIRIIYTVLIEPSTNLYITIIYTILIELSWDWTATIFLLHFTDDVSDDKINKMTANFFEKSLFFYHFFYDLPTIKYECQIFYLKPVLPTSDWKSLTPLGNYLTFNLIFCIIILERPMTSFSKLLFEKEKDWKIKLKINLIIPYYSNPWHRRKRSQYEND